MSGLSEGDRLREEILATGLSVYEFAKRIKMDPSTLYRYTAGSLPIGRKVMQRFKDAGLNIFHIQADAKQGKELHIDLGNPTNAYQHLEMSNEDPAILQGRIRELREQINELRKEVASLFVRLQKEVLEQVLQLMREQGHLLSQSDRPSDSGDAVILTAEQRDRLNQIKSIEFSEEKTK